VLYYIDDTQLKKQAEEYQSSRPAVLLVAMDSLDEIAHGLRDSEKAALTGGVEKIIETWSSQFDCVMRKYANSRYMMVVEERALQTMMQQRFNVLDSVRAYTYEGLTGVTLSIGVGRGDSLRECEDAARQALDMALGRGGDQAAVNTHGQFTFFGGVSQSVEKQTKVRTRIVASAIAELFEGSDTILIMGHRFADLDALGAAVGVWSAAHFFKKPAYIVMSRGKSLAKALVSQLDESGMRDFIMEPGDALQLLSKRTLLVVVDTHRPDFVEYPPLLEKVKTVIVIDHHRKTVNFIDNAVIFYHEPTASSASEMVTELLPYMSNKPFIDKLQAEALLAGIMLDTRDFVLRTGVHTFEAAAYLRGRGADTVRVKQLFSNSMEDHQLRNAITSNFDTYRGCAIAIADIESEDLRIIASQAADEMLNISGIQSSYVLYRTGDIVNISARSMGAMNVQLIMEMLGGGGHQTMAAAQLSNISVSDAKVRLLQVIDQFYAQINAQEEAPQERPEEMQN
ncbi:MAG: DHH family phosphoesterase, partial [Acutalibacteraceae bacterium]